MSEIVKVIYHGVYKYTLELQRCNKAACAKCPHGPYWYVTIPTPKGRQIRRYVGKKLPREVKA